MAYLFALVAIAFFICVRLCREHSKHIVPARVQSVQTNGPVSAATHRFVTQTRPDLRPVTEPGVGSSVDVRVPFESATVEMTNIALLWRTPLLYYGKVVDENSQPIPGVQVSYAGNSINESLTEEVRNEGVVITDDHGIFKIDGIFGIGLMFQLYHPDFYPYPDNPTGFDVRSPPRNGVIPDSESNAQVFRMHRKGRSVALIYRYGGFHAPCDGSIAIFPLRGRVRSEILGQLRIQGWINNGAQGAPFSWKLRLSLPEGGIVEKTNYFDFVAPDSGYSESVDVEVSHSESVRKEYFLRVPGGYLRFKLRVIMGDDMFVFGEYFFNPDQSRNLELDPNQVIQASQ